MRKLEEESQQACFIVITRMPSLGYKHYSRIDSHHFIIALKVVMLAKDLGMKKSNTRIKFNDSFCEVTMPQRALKNDLISPSAI